MEISAACSHSSDRHENFSRVNKSARRWETASSELFLVRSGTNVLKGSPSSPLLSQEEWTERDFMYISVLLGVARNYYFTRRTSRLTSSSSCSSIPPANRYARGGGGHPLRSDSFRIGVLLFPPSLFSERALNEIQYKWYVNRRRRSSNATRKKIYHRPRSHLIPYKYSISLWNSYDAVNGQTCRLSSLSLSLSLSLNHRYPVFELTRKLYD